MTCPNRRSPEERRLRRHPAAASSRRELVPAALLPLLLPVALTGCLYGFSGGGGLPSHISTVSVPPVVNETNQFALTDPFTRLLQDAIRGRLGGQLAAEDRADAIVRATITGYDDQALDFQQRGEGQAAQVFQRRVTIRASVEIYDRLREEAIWESSSVSGTGEYAPEQESEEVGRQLAMENLIQKVVNGAQSQW